MYSMIPGYPVPFMPPYPYSSYLPYSNFSSFPGRPPYPPYPPSRGPGYPMAPGFPQVPHDNGNTPLPTTNVPETSQQHATPPKSDQKKESGPPTSTSDPPETTSEQQYNMDPNSYYYGYPSGTGYESSYQYPPYNYYPGMEQQPSGAPADKANADHSNQQENPYGYHYHGAYGEQHYNYDTSQSTYYNDQNPSQN